MTASGGVLAQIRSLLPSLLPTEQAVAGVFLDRAGEVVEMSSQQVAELAGASRATVVRTCQSLGFSGYQQLRVLLARDGGPPPAPDAAPGTPGARVAQTFAHVAASVPAMVALLDHDDVAKAVAALADAPQVLVVGNGLSAALAVDAAARLVSLGRRAAAPPDVIGQQVAARLLSAGDTLLVVSGSGSSGASVKAAEAARRSGATIVLVTAFGRSPLTSVADVSLVVGMPDLTFRDELTLTSRIPQVILLEGLLAAVAERLGPAAAAATALTLEVVSANLAD